MLKNSALKNHVLFFGSFVVENVHINVGQHTGACLFLAFKRKAMQSTYRGTDALIGQSKRG